MNTLEEGGYIRSSAVRHAFLAVARELFVPEVARREGLPAVYADGVLVIRTGPRARRTSGDRSG